MAPRARWQTLYFGAEDHGREIPPRRLRMLHGKQVDVGILAIVVGRRRGTSAERDPLAVGRNIELNFHVETKPAMPLRREIDRFFRIKVDLEEMRRQAIGQPGVEITIKGILRHLAVIFDSFSFSASAPFSSLGIAGKGGQDITREHKMAPSGSQRGRETASGNSTIFSLHRRRR